MPDGSYLIECLNRFGSFSFILRLGEDGRVVLTWGNVSAMTPDRG